LCPFESVRVAIDREFGHPEGTGESQCPIELAQGFECCEVFRLHFASVGLAFVAFEFVLDLVCVAPTVRDLAFVLPEVALGLGHVELAILALAPVGPGVAIFLAH